MLNKIILLWAKLEKQLPKHQWETAHVFFLGDYVDKGPESKGVIEWLSTLHERAPPTQHHHFVIGNHDMAMATFLGLCKDSPGDEAFRATHAHVRAYDKNYLYDGPGANGMHLQGRRWAGQYDIYSSGERASACIRAYSCVRVCGFVRFNFSSSLFITCSFNI